jgi:hypothetical protein
MSHNHCDATLAGDRGAKFHALGLAALSGLLHDLGKYSQVFSAVFLEATPSAIQRRAPAIFVNWPGRMLARA